MTDVSIIGLGVMGAALARTLLDQGRSVTVWNRTARKAEPLVAAGADPAADPAAAVAASPLTIICVLTYENSHELLATLPGGALEGKTIVQLTTGSAADAERLAADMEATGAAYLDGAILAYPSDIGGGETAIVIAGSEDAWAASESTLQILAGASAYLGTNLRAPAAVNAGIIGPVIGLLFGVIHGANVCEIEGFSLESYAEFFPALLPLAVAQAQHIVSTIANDTFDDTEAALDTYASGVKRHRNDRLARGINAEFPAFASDWLDRAVQAGYGDQELSALIKILRT